MLSIRKLFGTNIKGRLCGKNNVLQQIVRHVMVENKRKCDLNSKSSHKFLKANGFTFRSRNEPSKNNALILNSGVIGFITSISEQIITLSVLDKDNSLFVSPVKSEVAGIYTVVPSQTVKIIKPSDIRSKVILFPHGVKFVAIEMLTNDF